MRVFLWNARGLSTDKLPLLAALSDKADLILITETHAPPNSDNLALPGYTCISLPRHFQHVRARTPSGGLACFIRSDLAPHTHQWHPRQQATHLWLHIAPSAGLPRPLFLCLAYLPPRSSTAYAQLPTPPLTAISSDLHAILALHPTADILLAGDSNARTATDPDGAAPFDHTTLATHIPELPPDLHHSPPPSLPARQSTDTKRPSAQGRDLLSLLQEHLLAILNGRTPSDTPAALTCLPKANQPGGSTVDYFASSLTLWPADADLAALPPTPALSDHRPLLHTLPRSSAPATPAPATPPSIPKFHYDPTEETTAQYRAALASDPLLSPAHLSSLPGPQAALLLQERLLHHVAAAHPPRPPPPTHRHPARHRNQPWFDAECKATRRRLRTALANPSTHISQHLLRQFKALCQSKKSAFTRSRLTRLLDDARHNPAAFWRQFRPRNSANKISSAATWHSYCRSLFALPPRRPPPRPASCPSRRRHLPCSPLHRH